MTSGRLAPDNCSTFHQVETSQRSKSKRARTFCSSLTQDLLESVLVAWILVFPGYMQVFGPQCRSQGDGRASRSGPSSLGVYSEWFYRDHSSFTGMLYTSYSRSQYLSGYTYVYLDYFGKLQYHAPVHGAPFADLGSNYNHRDSPLDPTSSR